MLNYVPICKSDRNSVSTDVEIGRLERIINKAYSGGIITTRLNLMQMIL